MPASSLSDVLRTFVSHETSSSAIARAWANFGRGLIEANEANSAFDTARDGTVDANIMDPHREIADVAREHGVEPAREKMNRANQALTLYRRQLIDAYRAEFGDEGVRRLVVFLTALQRFGGVHPMVQIGQRGVTLQQTGPAAIRAASDDLGRLWL